VSRTKYFLAISTPVQGCSAIGLRTEPPQYPIHRPGGVQGLGEGASVTSVSVGRLSGATCGGMPATLAPALACLRRQSASLTAAGDRRGSVENFLECENRPWRGRRRHLHSAGPFWHRLCYNDILERARACPRSTQVAGGSGSPSTLIVWVPRLRLVQPWSSAGTHGCKLRSRGTHRFNRDRLPAILH